MQTWNLQSQNEDQNTKSQIETTLKMFKPLIKMQSARGNLEIRLLDVFLPFSILSIDSAKNSGAMVIDFHAYKTSHERPHVILTCLDTPKWYNFYIEQFEQAWSDASVWTGIEASIKENL